MLRRVHVRLPVGQSTGRLEGNEPFLQEVAALWHREDLGHAGTTLVNVSTHLPESPQRAAQLQSGPSVVAGDGPVKRRPKVIVLHLQPVEPVFPLATEHMWLSLLGQCQERLDMSVFDRSGFVTLLQLLRREYADRLEHQETGLTEIRKPAEKALVSQLIERVDHVATDISRRAAHRFDLFQAPTAGENREAGQQAPAGRLDHVIAPL